MMQIARMPESKYQLDLKTSSGVPPCSSLESLYWESSIIREINSAEFVLTGEVKACCAISCVIVPQPGDTVLCYSSYSKSDEQQTYILAILQREQSENARLTVPGHNTLKISQANIQCHASKEIELGSLENIKLTSVRGNVEMRAQNLVQTVVGSIIESARERISNADFIQFCASFLTRIHSHQTIVTADSDIKIDAERVNLG